MTKTSKIVLAILGGLVLVLAMVLLSGFFGVLLMAYGSPDSLDQVEARIAITNAGAVTLTNAPLTSTGNLLVQSTSLTATASSLQSSAGSASLLISQPTPGDPSVPVATRLQRRLGERIEIVSGLEAGARIAVDGAAYLSDGAPVKLREQGS